METYMRSMDETEAMARRQRTLEGVLDVLRSRTAAGWPPAMRIGLGGARPPALFDGVIAWDEERFLVSTPEVGLTLLPRADFPEPERLEDLIRLAEHGVSRLSTEWPTFGGDQPPAVRDFERQIWSWDEGRVLYCHGPRHDGLLIFTREEWEIVRRRHLFLREQQEREAFESRLHTAKKYEGLTSDEEASWRRRREEGWAEKRAEWDYGPEHEEQGREIYERAQRQRQEAARA